MSEQFDLDAAVAAAQARLDAARMAKARADAARDKAAADEAALRAQLHRSFGISTVAEAQQMLADLDTQLAQRVAALTAALEEAETT